MISMRRALTAARASVQKGALLLKRIYCLLLIGLLVFGLTACREETAFQRRQREWQEKGGYVAEATLYVLSEKDAVINVADLRSDSSLVQDYLRVFSSDGFLSACLLRINGDTAQSLSQADLRERICIENPEHTRMLNIYAVSYRNRKEAAELALAVTEAFREYAVDDLGGENPVLMTAPLAN